MINSELFCPLSYRIKKEIGHYNSGVKIGHVRLISVVFTPMIALIRCMPITIGLPVVSKTATEI